MTRAYVDLVLAYPQLFIHPRVKVVAYFQVGEVGIRGSLPGPGRR